MRLKLLHKQTDCIGCNLCAEVAPAYWLMNDDGIAILRTPKGQDGPFDVAEGFHEDIDALEEAERSCPVQIIRVV